MQQANEWYVVPTDGRAKRLFTYSLVEGPLHTCTQCNNGTHDLFECPANQLHALLIVKEALHLHFQIFLKDDAAPPRLVVPAAAKVHLESQIATNP